MSRSARRWLDVLALAVIGVGALAAAALAANTGDTPVPPRGLGASFAGRLHSLFGWTVYPALIGWFALGFAVLLEGRRGRWSWRVLGWFLLVPGLALLSGESAGRLGAALEALSTSHLAAPWPLFIGLGGLLVGVVLAGDFIWPPLLRWQGRKLAAWFDDLRMRWAAYRADRARRRLFGKSRARGMGVLPAGRTGGMPVGRGDTPVPHARGGIPIRHPTMIGAKPGTTAAAVRETNSDDFELPPFDLLNDPEPFPYEQHEGVLRDRGLILEKTFAEFGLNVKVVGINTGPVITQFEVALETGLRLNKVTRLADDIALKLKVPSVRMVAPIPGKDTVGVELPNEHRAVVGLKEVILSSAAAIRKQKLPLFLGKDTEGHPLVYDLAEMPHLLIAGRTGTGKSVCMNAIILSMLMTRRPDEVQMIMIDPKMLEMSEYGKIPHLMHPVVKDMKKAEAILAWAVDKMEERYELLSRARVRNIASYNELAYSEILRRVNPMDEEDRRRTPPKMPYIVIFIDEMNDLMMTMRKEVESHIIRLAQKSRAAGIHLIVATQKPTVDVITGLIKSNLPARICFQVSSRTDSRVVLDEMGADKLLGRGDMLFLQPGTSTIIRAQGTYASDPEISSVVEFLECDQEFEPELMQLGTAGSGTGAAPGAGGFQSRDDLYDQAVEVVVREGRGSVSLLQRALGIGYGRAARLIDFMAEDGIVGPYNGSNAREVLLQPGELRARERVNAGDAA